MKYKYLLFDADNTLFDFDAAERKAFLSLSDLCPEAFDERTYPIYHEINDGLWKALERKEITREKLRSERFRRYLETVGAPSDEDTVALVTKTYPERLSRGNDLISGAQELLRNLYGKYEIYIITNGIASVQIERLCSSLIKPFVKDIFISEEIGYEKPDKRYFDAVLTDLGVSKEECLVIGDSLTSDIDGAIGYGIDCVYIDRKGHGADGRPVNYIIHELSQLGQIL